MRDENVVPNTEAFDRRWDRAELLQKRIVELELESDPRIARAFLAVDLMGKYFDEPVMATSIKAATAASIISRELEARTIEGLTPRESIRPSLYEQEHLNELTIGLVDIFAATKEIGDKEAAKVDNLLVGLQLAATHPDVRIGAYNALMLFRLSSAGSATTQS